MREHVKASFAQLLEPQLSLSFLQDDEPSAAPAPRSQGSSNLATAMIICKCCFGSAFLIVPCGFKEAGVVLGPLCIIVVYIFMLAGMLKLIDCRRTWGQPVSFQDMGSALGPWGRAYINLGLMLLCAGFCSIWVVTCMENLAVTLPHWSSSRRLWASFPCILPLTWVRRLNVFTVTNMIGTVLCMATYAYLFYLALGKLCTDGVQEVTLVNTANTDALLWVGACGYIFELINAIVPTYEAAEDKVVMQRLLIGFTLVFLVLYISIGVVFYCAYGGDTASLATLNLPKHTVSSYIFPAVFVVVGVVTLPIPFFVMVQTYEPSIRWSEDYRTRKWQKNFARTLAALAIYSLTWLGGAQLQNFLGLVGGLLGSNLAIVVPCLLHLAICKPAGVARCCDRATCAVGVAMMACSTYQAVTAWK